MSGGAAHHLPCPLCEAPVEGTFAQIGEWTFRRCERCRLVFRDSSQLPSPEEERAHYAHHRNSPDDPGYRSFLDRLATPLAAVLPPGATGLDYGAGPGPTLSRMLTERGHPTASWDPLFSPAPRLLERTWDFITCTEVVEHLHRPRETFLELDQLLRPGGWLGVMTEVRRPESPFETWWYVRDPTHVAFYERRTFAWIASCFRWTVTRPGRTVLLFRKSTGASGVQSASG